MRAIIFDMDGTLFETERVCLEAMYRTFDFLRAEGYHRGETPPDELLLNQLGKAWEPFWSGLLPGADRSVWQKADEVMFGFEKELIEQGKGRLYPGVKEILPVLKEEGYSLFVASNGREEYVDAIVTHFRIKDLFTDLYSAGRFGTRCKCDLVRLLVDRYSVEDGYMVGDRKSDVEAGKANGLTVIGCQFGFARAGELEEADVIVGSFVEILGAVKQFHGRFKSARGVGGQ